MKILLPEENVLTRGDIDLGFFNEFGETVILENPSREELEKELADTDVMFVNKLNVDGNLLEKAPKLRYIGECATGFNNIDLEACKEKNITVTNVPAYSTMAVAQHTWALILEHFSRVYEYDAFVRNDGWINSPVFAPFVYNTEEISEKTLGLIGCGKIGKQVAKIGNAFGVNVIAFTRTRQSGSEDGIEYCTLERCLRESDIISVHCPLTEETFHLINSETIGEMKDGAFIVNTARGPVINEKDLAEALKSGKLSGAGLDVIEKEPMERDCPLIGIENCIITPHVAWAPRETRERLIEIVRNNYVSYLEGHTENRIV